MKENMELRDYFAAQLMSGMANQLYSAAYREKIDESDDDTSDKNYRQLSAEEATQKRIVKASNMAYRIADAMMEARKDEKTLLNKTQETNNMFKGIIIERGDGSIDEDKLDINGITNLDERIVFEMTIPVSFNFELKRAIGIAKVWIDTDYCGRKVLKANFFLNKGESDYGKLYPAIAGQIFEGGSGKPVTKFKLTSIALCLAPNPDLEILTLEEQMNIVVPHDAKSK